MQQIYQLPHWVIWCQALGPFLTPALLACFATWIGLQQIQLGRNQEAIARAKLSFDVYDRRYAIFDSFRKMIGKILGAVGDEGYETPEAAIHSATWSLGEAEFLLDYDSVAVLRKLRSTAISLSGSRTALNNLRGGPNEAIEAAWIKQGDQEKELLDSFPELVGIFLPYLRPNDLK